MENNTEVMMKDTIPTTTEDNSTNEVDGTPTPGNTEATSVEEAKPFKVRYKHKDVELSADDARNYAQKGMKYDDIAPMLDDLNYYATIKDKKPHDLLKELIANEEKAYHDDLIERFGDDEEAITLLMDKHRNENKSRFEKAVADSKKAEEDAELQEVQALEGRIATEFSELNQEFPEIKGIEDVPKSVLKEAENGRNLFDAYLRYKHAESLKVNSAKQTAEANSKATTGSMSAPNEVDDAIAAAFLEGLRS